MSERLPYRSRPPSARLDESSPWRAAAALDAALAMEGDEPEALFARAAVHRRDGDLDAAAQKLTRAIALKPMIAAIPTLLARVMSERGALDEATAVLQSFSERFGEHPGVLLAAGKLQWRRNEHRNAIALAKRSLAIRPGDVTGRKFMAAFLAWRGLHRDAAHHLETADRGLSGSLDRVRPALVTLRERKRANRLAAAVKLAKRPGAGQPERTQGRPVAAPGKPIKRPARRPAAGRPERIQRRPASAPTKPAKQIEGWREVPQAKVIAAVTRLSTQMNLSIVLLVFLAGIADFFRPEKLITGNLVMFLIGATVTQAFVASVTITILFYAATSWHDGSEAG